jgi:hypothetical protein
MVILPLDHGNAFNDFMATYAVMLYPANDSGRAEFLERQYSIMRMNCVVSRGGVDRYASLAALSPREISRNSFHRLADRVGLFSAALIPSLSRINPRFNRYVLKALPQSREMDLERQTDPLALGGPFWNRFKSVAHLYVALPSMIRAGAKANLAFSEDGDRHLPFRLDLGAVDLDRFYEFLFIAESIRVMTEARLRGPDGRPLLEPGEAWQAPADMPVDADLLAAVPAAA